MGESRSFQHLDPGLPGKTRPGEFCLSNLVLLTWDGPVAALTLNRPERHNSLIPALLEDLLGHIAEVAGQPGVRAAILQANGRSFSTGGDLQAFADHLVQLEAYASRIVGLLNRAMLALIDLPVPVIGAVQGPVTGGSLGLVLACDVVLLAPEATFTPYYGPVGFSPDGGWTAMLPAVIGTQRTAEILLANRTIRPEQAVSWGLASQVVPAGDLQDTARAAAEEMAQMDPGSLQRTKRLLRADRGSLARRLAAEREQFVAQIRMAETQRRMTAFLDHMKKR